MSMHLQPTVDELLKAGRILTHHGLCEAFGHISARLSRERILMSPRRALGLVTASALVELDVDDSRLVNGQPPLEAEIHLGIYRRNPSVGAVMRIHSFAASVLSVIAEPIRPMHYLASILGSRIPIDDDPSLVVDKVHGTAVADRLGAGSAIMLRGNGQVAVGSNVREACVRALYLDEAARLQLACLQTGRTARPLTHEELSSFSTTWQDTYNVHRAWEFYCTEVAEDPEWDGRHRGGPAG